MITFLAWPQDERDVKDMTALFQFALDLLKVRDWMVMIIVPYYKTLTHIHTYTHTHTHTHTHSPFH